MEIQHAAPLGPSKRSGTILKEIHRILRAPRAPRSASERSPALQGAPSRPPRPSGLPKSFSNAFRVRHARPGARRSAPRRSKAGQTSLRGLQGFQEAFPTRLECAMRAPERVRALPGAPSAPRRSKARQACGRLQACARVARGRQTRPLALPLPPLEFSGLSKRSGTVSQKVRRVARAPSTRPAPRLKHAHSPALPLSPIRSSHALLAPAAAQRRNSSPAT